jgi:hypothetical protein
MIDDGPGDSGPSFDFITELGCASSLVAFVFFLVVALVLWQVFLN